MFKSNLKKNFSKLFKSLHNDNKFGLIITLKDKPGELLRILNIFNKHNLNLSYISSKPSQIYNENNKNLDIFIDIDYKSDKKSSIDTVMTEIKSSGIGIDIQYNDIKNIPWFPKCRMEMNEMGTDVLLGGESLQSDHPGFNDEEYKRRRTVIEKKSSLFRFDKTNFVEDVEYSKEETELWKSMYNLLEPLILAHASEEFINCFIDLKSKGLLISNKIPQLQDFNEYYKTKTGMFLRPTGGLLSQREFLNSLAFNVFPCTQYIRHSSKPLYTPEPDIIHEIFGHASMLADNDFVKFSQEIGIASLGATDEEIKSLGNIYWFSLEFGICHQKGENKIYGGGILSSPAEIENAVSGKVGLLPFDLKRMAAQEPDITNIQTSYYLAPSFKEMVVRIKEYSGNVKKSFNVSYNEELNCVDIDRRIVGRESI